MDLRILAYNVASVALGLVVLVVSVTTVGAWDDKRVFPNVLAKALALLIIAGSLGATAYVRRERRKWLRNVARYRSFSAFAAELKESRGVIEDLGVTLLYGVGSGLGRMLKAMLDAPRELTIQEAYELLLRQRREGKISEHELRKNIDELFLAAGGRA